MALLIALWVLFFVSHSVLAANQVKVVAGKLLGKAFVYYRIAYNLLSLIFLGVILYLLFFKQELQFMFEPHSRTAYAGLALMVAGIVVTLLAFRNYDLAEFTGFKQLAQKIHHPEKLMITGMNRYVRNPLYTGLLLLVFGYFIQQPTQMNLVSMLIIYAYIYIGTRFEEQKLEQVFGNEYRVYKTKVKMLIPFLF